MQSTSEISIQDKRIIIRGRLFKIASLRSEHYQQFEDPDGFIPKLTSAKTGADLFTFLQHIGDLTPHYPYRLESECIAVLPLTTYEHWWKKQINDKTRNMARKAQKSGLEIRVVEFNDAFVRGIKGIYDESPIRQGKRFAHYGNDLETLRQKHITWQESSDFIGAYLGDELVGFIKLVHGKYASSLMQILSKLAHRDKAPTNALTAKAVEICTQRGVPYLHYGIWGRGGLNEYKIRHGFQRMDLPRYFVPLSPLGRIGLNLRLHRKMADCLPDNCLDKLTSWRSKWNEFRYCRVYL